MKNINIGLLLFILTLSACGQSKVDCNQIRKDQPHIVKYKQGGTDSLLALDIKIIRPCLNLDPIDAEILNYDVLAVQVAELNLDRKVLNYGIIIDHIIEQKSSDQYRKSRKAFEFAQKYENRKINKTDSTEVRRNFKEMGLSDSDLNELLTMVYSNENSHLTYEEVFNLFSEQKNPSSTQDASQPKSDNLIFGHFRTIESKKQLRDQFKPNRPLLLYFTGYADIESKKMEEALFQNPEILILLDEFNCFLGYTDDKSGITKEQQAEFEDTEFRTKGQFITEIQKSITGKLLQPMILIVDKELEPVDSYANNKNADEFIDFLKRNNNVR